MFPAASVAVALNVVVVLGPTPGSRPNDPNTAAVSVAACVPEQSPVLYSFTIDPASAVPVTAGLELWFGEEGDTANPVGGSGAMSSWV